MENEDRSQIGLAGAGRSDWTRLCRAERTNSDAGAAGGSRKCEGKKSLVKDAEGRDVVKDVAYLSLPKTIFSRENTLTEGCRGERDARRSSRRS